jgi:hypothetical protein
MLFALHEPYSKLVLFVLGTGKQTERFVSNGSEGTLYNNTNSYFLNYVCGDNVIRELTMEQKNKRN